VVDAERLVLSDTRVPAGTVGGDGLYLGATARLTVDEALNTAAAALPTPAMRDALLRGRGSLLVRNARAGILADGDRLTETGADAGTSRDPAAASELALYGAFIASNSGPGVFVQRRAVATSVSYADLYDNSQLGLGISGGGIYEANCTTVHGTRLGYFTPENSAVSPFLIGDGASFADQSTSTMASINYSHFDDNARFGAIFRSFQATLRGVTGRGNRFNARADVSTVDREQLAAIRGISASVEPLVLVANHSVEPSRR
jgi:hypothetical protein